jgi:hypothetical protein
VSRKTVKTNTVHFDSGRRKISTRRIKEGNYGLGIADRLPQTRRELNRREDPLTPANHRHILVSFYPLVLSFEKAFAVTTNIDPRCVKAWGYTHLEPWILCSYVPGLCAVANTHAKNCTCKPTSHVLQVPTIREAATLRPSLRGVWVLFSFCSFDRQVHWPQRVHHCPRGSQDNQHQLVSFPDLRRLLE